MRVGASARRGTLRRRRRTAHAQAGGAGCGHAPGLVEIHQRLVLRQRQRGQLALQRVEDEGELLALQAGLVPGLDQGQAPGLRAQDVGRGQLRVRLQPLRALAHGLEADARLLLHQQGHARGADAVFHHVVVQQRQAVQSGAAGRGRGGGQGQRSAPGSAGALHPACLVRLPGQPGIAALLHLALRGRLAHEVFQEARERPGQRRQAGGHAVHEMLARQLGEPVGSSGGQGGFHGCHGSRWPGRPRRQRPALSQTMAPAFGSSGSPSFLVAVLTRSSRLTPSHMAIAAATNTDE